MGRFAFTLVELLVVLSIIALLVALLMPALQMARGQARLVACAGQLRQNGISHLMYADAHDGWFPVVRHATEATIGMDSSIPDGMGSSHTITEWYGTSRRQWRGYTHFESFLCPTTRYWGAGSPGRLPQYAAGSERNLGVGAAGNIRAVQASYRFPAARGTRGYAQFYGYDTGSPPWWTFYGRHRLSAVPYRDDNRVSPVIPNRDMADRVVDAPRAEDDDRFEQRYYIHPPNMMPMIMDARHQTSDWWTPYAAGANHYNNHFRLGRMMNILFLDGHAIAAEQPAVDDNGNLIPGSVPGEPRTRLWGTGDYVYW